MHQQETEDQHLRVAEIVRAACLAAAQESYEEASMRGLCHEGAWEYAMGVVRTLDLRSVLSPLTTLS
ncbi:MAG: acetyltransferase [Candidatus Binatia bacterium]